MDPAANNFDINDYMCPIDQEPLTTAVKLNCSNEHRVNETAANLLFAHNIDRDTKCPICREAVSRFIVDEQTRDIVRRIENNAQVSQLQAPAAKPENPSKKVDNKLDVKAGFDEAEIEQAIRNSLPPARQQSQQVANQADDEFDADQIEQAIQNSLQSIQQERRAQSQPMQPPQTRPLPPIPSQQNAHVPPHQTQEPPSRLQLQHVQLFQPSHLPLSQSNQQNRLPQNGSAWPQPTPTSWPAQIFNWQDNTSIAPFPPMPYGDLQPQTNSFNNQFLTSFEQRRSDMEQSRREMQQRRNQFLSEFAQRSQEFNRNFEQSNREFEQRKQEFNRNFGQFRR